MTDLLQLLIAGLATGAIYALAAIGFTLLWQTSQTINFAQGEFVMVPAFFAWMAINWWHLPVPLALVLAILLSMALLGVVFRYAIVGPLLGRGVLPLVISTLALSVLMKESVKELVSAQAESFPSLLPDTVVHVAGVAISIEQFGMLAIAAAVWMVATEASAMLHAWAGIPQQIELFAQVLELPLPVTRHAEPRERTRKGRVLPARRKPCAVVEHPHRAQRLDVGVDVAEHEDHREVARAPRVGPVPARQRDALDVDRLHVDHAGRQRAAIGARFH